MERQNSQRKQSLTCILAVGDSRSPRFQLMRRRTKEETGKGFIKLNVEDASKEFKLSNGFCSSCTQMMKRINEDLNLTRNVLHFFSMDVKVSKVMLECRLVWFLDHAVMLKEVSKSTGQLIEPEHDIGLLQRTKGKLEDFLAGRTTTKDGMTKDQANKWLQMKYLQT